MGISMSNNKRTKLLTDKLPCRRPTPFNPWRDRCTDDRPCNGLDAKLARLDANPGFVPLLATCDASRSLRCTRSLLTAVSHCRCRLYH